MSENEKLLVLKALQHYANFMRKAEISFKTNGLPALAPDAHAEYLEALHVVEVWQKIAEQPSGTVTI